MSDLEVAFLGAALRFAGAHLQSFLSDETPTTESLLAAVLGSQPSAAQQSQLAAVAATAEANRGAALSAADAIVASSPQSLSDTAAVCANLSSALDGMASLVSTLSAVSGVPAVAPGVQRLLRAALVAGGGPDIGGLAAQLGLQPGPDTPAVTGTTVTVTLTNPNETTIPGAGVFGIADARLVASFDWNNAMSFELRFTGSVDAGLVGDAFLQQLMPASTSVKANVSVSIDPVDGLTFGPKVRHRIALPAHVDVFGVELRDFALELPDPSELGAGAAPALAFTATIAGSLGPVAAVVDGFGIELRIDADDIVGGAPNPATVGPRPPVGAGLAIDAGPVKGGGYVRHKGNEYGGALDLAVGPVEIKAVGLISTDPFSLVLVLSVEFTPGIQLSFGFTLNGVGGLLALERTISTDALRAGLHNHTIDALLFPPDPVSAAPHILNALSESFPPQPGAFVVGPMLEIGWGVPISLVTAKVGVLIALTDPKVIILGIVRVALPSPEAAIVDLRAELYGEITPDHLLVLVSLEGSRVAGFALGGDFGLLIAYGDSPDFAITAGGFHPHYKPPTELAGMHRVSMNLSPPALLTLRATAYFALTSNSFQLGAHIELKADLAVVSAEGHLGFDALVIWSPRFQFEIDLTAGISVYVFGSSFAGVDLHLHLEGPGPWMARGTGSVSFLFFDVDFEVGPITWGEGDNPPPDGRSPVDLVAEALDEPKSWHAVAPEQGDRVAKIADVTPPAGTILVHPLGAFEVRQHVAPLETHIDHIGPHPVSEHRVNFTNPLVGPAAAKAVSETTDRFAPGQFLDLTNDEKLARPAFEPFPSGMRLSGASGDTFGSPVESNYEWDTCYPHEDFDRERHVVWFTDQLRATAVRTGPVAVSDLRAPDAYYVAPDPIVLADAGAVVVRNTKDLGTLDGLTHDVLTTTAAARVIVEAVSSGAVADGEAQLVGLGVAP